MLDLSTFVMFAAACLALAITPGPDMLLVASRAASQGRAAGFVTLAGIQAGTCCHVFAAVFGLSRLFLVVPFAYDGLRYLGAAYLLFLAWKSFRAPDGATAQTPEAPRYRLGKMFRQGLLTNLFNPKVALFMLALLPQFLHPERGAIALQALLLALTFNVIGLLVNGAVIFAAGRLGAALSGRSRFARAPQYFLGTVFTGLAIRLAI